METKTIEQMTNAEILKEYFETSYDSFISCKIIDTHINILEIEVKLKGSLFAPPYVNIQQVNFDHKTIYGEINIELVKLHIASKRIYNN